MNKISKKIVALATMAAFVLTLVPAAAFGAEAPLKSSVSVDSNTETLTLVDGTAVKADIDLTIGSGDQKSAPVYVWLTKDDSNEIYRYAEFTAKSENNDAVAPNGSTGELVNAVKVNGTYVNQGGTIDITAEISEAGTYKVHAGIAAVAGDYASRSDLSTIDVDGAGTITVKAADTVVKSITVSEATANAAGGTMTYNGTPNSTTVTPVTVKVDSVYASTEAGNPSSEGKVISIDNGNNAVKGLSVLDAKTGKATDVVTVGDDNTAKFNLKAETGTKSGEYVIYLSADKVEYKLVVVVGSSSIQSIEAVDNGTAVVPNSDYDFDGVVEFVFKDASGNTVDAPADLAFAVTSQPEDSNDKISAGDLSIAKNAEEDAYKLVINNHATLAVGEYSVRVALTDGTGAHADATFTVAKPGDTESLVIEMDNNAETVVSGQTVKGTVYTVDENGIKQHVKNGVQIGLINSPAADKDTTVTIDSSDGRFQVKAKSDEKYLGSKITIFAFDTQAKTYVTKELTVVDGLSENTLSFDSEEGPILKDNTVNVSVVDENGKVVNVGGTMYAYVESTSNENAKVDVSDAIEVKAGKAKLTVFSNEETTAKIVVAIKDGNAVYANTLEYTFGEEDILADTSVVMTIGSPDFVVNNKVITKEDSAPYIANDRTYVPFRALGEALGAEVNWDNDARTVTYTLGNTEVVLTIDETTYTVNGEEKTMDVAPVITGDRTYVPVRFVGEALGFSVTALYDTNGTTASVVFQK